MAWKYLQYDGETGKRRTVEGGGGGASSLADLEDTNITEPSDGQVLKFDEDNSKWINGNPVDISNKADKVTGGTNGNLAKLDANGNLADAGWASDKTTTSATGNPISISGLKSNQLAINPIITFNEIQGGSGYDNVALVVCGKNKIDASAIQRKDNYYIDDNGTEYSGGVAGYTLNYILVERNTEYTISGSGVGKVYFYDQNKNWISRYPSNSQSTFTFTTPNNCTFIRIHYLVANIDTSDWQLEVGSAVTTYESYKYATSISESLGQAVSGGTWDVRNGLFTTSNNAVIHLIPHEISLLKDYVYILTNGTSISISYHTGEMASLGDVSQAAETVNKGLGSVIDISNDIVKESTVTNFAAYGYRIGNIVTIHIIGTLSSQYGYLAYIDKKHVPRSALSSFSAFPVNTTITDGDGYQVPSYGQIGSTGRVYVVNKGQSGRTTHVTATYIAN